MTDQPEYITRQFIVCADVEADADPEDVASDLLDLLVGCDAIDRIRTYSYVQPAPDNPRCSTVTEFRVSRTSGGDGQPCPEARQGTFTRHIYCTLPLAEAMESPRTEWFRRLVNHRPAPGGSVADAPDTPCWFVDIPDLAGLEAFTRRHGSVVVEWDSDGPTIEIYDGYRE